MIFSSTEKAENGNDKSSQDDKSDCSCQCHKNEETAEEEAYNLMVNGEMQFFYQDTCIPIF